MQSKQVCVLGLGSIGLPTACLLATSGYHVLGVDTNENVIKNVVSKEFSDPEPQLQELLKKVLQKGHLKVSTQVALADVHLIAVPTPLGPDNQPVLDHLHAAIDSIQPYLRAQDLVLIESTCPIGTTEILAKKLRAHCPGVRIAYCPERVLPGNILYELVHNDRIVGGIDEASTLHAISFYRSFVSGEILPTATRTAEAVKLAENTYRDINIAYANELSMIAEKLSLDVNELIRLANRHPRVQILKPGAGVGGRCIAVNPWFLISSAPDLTTLTKTAREINQKKANWVIEKIRSAIEQKKASTVACLGLTYKADVADTRESPALTIVQALEKEIEVLRVDPYVSNTTSLKEALARSEIIVGLIPHLAFQSIHPQELAGKTVLDFAGVFH